MTESSKLISITFLPWNSIVGFSGNVRNGLLWITIDFAYICCSHLRMTNLPNWGPDIGFHCNALCVLFTISLKRHASENLYIIYAHVVRMECVLLVRVFFRQDCTARQFDDDDSNMVCGCCCWCCRWRRRRRRRRCSAGCGICTYV